LIAKNKFVDKVNKNDQAIDKSLDHFTIFFNRN
jgi:hypothetical protein